MKVSRPTRPWTIVPVNALAMSSLPGPARVGGPARVDDLRVDPRGASPVSARGVGSAAAPERADFAGLYDAWFDDVLKWLRALGAPAADQEDLAQEVFLVVRRRLVDFDHRNVAGWLFRIASRQVAAHKRRKWWKAVVSRRPDLELDDLPDRDAGPAAALEQKERRKILKDLLERLPEKRRTTFMLFELEGYSGDEIARLQSIPVATVWTRLHHARKDLFGLVESLRREGGMS
jgi:RNA polymerase sigma-70 factor, ECF subfamily